MDYSPVTHVLSVLCIVFAVVGLAVSAVLQGVDAIGLKVMVDAWAEAPPEEEAIAFAAAETMRWIEISINSIFRLLQGTTFVLFGVILSVHVRYPRWVGWIGIIAGAVIIARGFAVAVTGFDPANPVYAYSGLFIELLHLWLLGLAGLCWYQSNNLD